MKSIYLIGSLVQGENLRSTLEVVQDSDGFKISYQCKNQEIVAYDTAPFFALVKIRLELEKQNCFLLCNGARKDVYPSGMSSEGFHAYVLDFHHSEQRLVHIFGFTNKVDKLCTVSEQFEYRDSWVKCFES